MPYTGGDDQERNREGRAILAVHEPHPLAHLVAQQPGAVEAVRREVTDVMAEHLLPAVAEKLASTVVDSRVPAFLVIDANRHLGCIDRLEQKRLKDEFVRREALHNLSILVCGELLGNPPGDGCFEPGTRSPGRPEGLRRPGPPNPTHPTRAGPKHLTHAASGGGPRPWFHAGETGSISDEPARRMLAAAGPTAPASGPEAPASTSPAESGQRYLKAGRSRFARIAPKK